MTNTDLLNLYPTDCPYEPCDRCPMLCKKQGSVTQPLAYSNSSEYSGNLNDFNPDSKTHLK